MFRRLFRLRPTTPQRVEAEMREEIEAHVAAGVEYLVARGADPATAEREVRARFGDTARAVPALVASAQRRERGGRRREQLADWLRDIRFAARLLKRSPEFAAGIVLSLAFGLGSSATVFSWMEGLILRPFPALREIDRLVNVRPLLANGFGISVAELEDWRAEARSVTDLTAVSMSLLSVQQGGESISESARPVYGMYVSANYFDLLGVRLQRGRAFLPGEDAEGAPPVAVLSDALWRRLGGSPSLVGETIRVNGSAVRVVGIAPGNFSGTIAAAKFDVWIPLSTRPLLMPLEQATWRRRDNRWLDVIGRLAPGVSVQEAHAEFSAIGRRHSQTYMESRGRGVRAIPLDFGTIKQIEPMLYTLMAITWLVILLVCSNVANLLLARATTRQRELAVRVAMGASRLRLVRQLMIESGMLALAGAALGAAFAVWGYHMLTTLMPTSSVPLGPQSGISLRFVAFTVAITAGAVLLFGLGPAFVGSRLGLAGALKGGSRGSGAAGSVRTALVVVQFAIALSALVFTALFLRRDRLVNSMDFGLSEPERVLLVHTDMSIAGVRDLAAWKRTLTEATDRVRALPGVRGADVASFVPLGFLGYVRRPVEVAGHTPESGVPDRLLVSGVGPRYFDLMRLAVVAGRGITAEDTPDTRRVAVVNEAFVARFFAGASALGGTFRLGGDSLTIVGVVRDGKYDYRTVDEPTQPFVYYALEQAPAAFVTIHVRTEGAPLASAPSIQAALRAVDPDLVVMAPVTHEEYSSVPFLPTRQGLKVLGILATAALVLASMGLYAVVSYGVAARTREVGIRIALGATPARVVALFLGESAIVIGGGLAAGMLAALGLVLVVGSVLPMLPAAQLADFTVPMLVLASSAAFSSLIPARRVTRVDPAITLREE